MKQVPLNAMIDAIYQSLNNDMHTSLTDLYFQTLIEKLKLLDSNKPLQILNDEALAIIKGMLLLALQETNIDAANYLINKIQQLSENMLGIRFDLANLHTNTGLLKNQCDEFDDKVMTSFNCTKIFIFFLKCHAQNMQGEFNIFRGKALDATVFYHARSLNSIQNQLRNIYSRQDISLYERITQAKIVFDDIGATDSSRSKFKQFCNARSYDLEMCQCQFIWEYGLCATKSKAFLKP